MHTPHSIIEHTHSEILVRPIECQVSRGDTSDEIVHHYCNLGYALKHGKRHYWVCDTKYHKWCSQWDAI